MLFFIKEVLLHVTKNRVAWNAQSNSAVGSVFIFLRLKIFYFIRWQRKADILHNGV